MQMLEFRNVHFHYPDGKEVLHNVSFELEAGKAYALVGPTGGGKTKSPTSWLDCTIRRKVWSILMDAISAPINRRRGAKSSGYPAGHVSLRRRGRQNIIYGVDEYRDCSSAQLQPDSEEANLSGLITRFPEGLETRVVGDRRSY